jgi:TLD
LSLGGNALILYTSDVHGLSFMTFQCAMVLYNRKTLIVIQSITGDIIGYYTEFAWKESTTPHGMYIVI